MDVKRPAEVRFSTAVNGLAHQLENIMTHIEDGIKDSVEGVTNTMVAGVRDIKSEFDVAARVRREPWTWMCGAAAVGAGAALLARRSWRRPAQVAARAGGPGLNWLVFLGEVGLTIWRNRVARDEEQRSRVAHGRPQERLHEGFQKQG